MELPFLKNQRLLSAHIAELEGKLGRNVNPLLFLVEIAAGHDQYAEELAKRMVAKGIWHENSVEVEDMCSVSRADRVAAATTAVKYFYPQLAAAAITTSATDKPQISAEVQGLIGDDSAAEALENLAIVMAHKRTAVAQLEFDSEVNNG